MLRVVGCYLGSAIIFILEFLCSYLSKERMKLKGWSASKGVICSASIIGYVKKIVTVYFISKHILGLLVVSSDHFLE